MQTEGSIDIDRPIDRVFDYTTEQVARWSRIVVQEEVIHRTAAGVGTTFRAITEDRGCRMTFDGTVTRHEPPTSHAVEMTGRQFDIVAEYTFEDLGGRTRVTQRSTVRPKGVLKLMFLLLGPFMKRSNCDALAQELAQLKEQLESDSTF